MGALFDVVTGSLLSPGTPKEDPATAAARKRQQANADQQYTDDTQTDLLRRTRQRIAQYGLATPGAAPPSTGGLRLSGFNPFSAGPGLPGSFIRA